MTIESEIAGLTQATTDLLAAVNVRKATLDEKVSMATAQAGLATTNGAEQVALAAVQAASAASSAAAALAASAFAFSSACHMAMAAAAMALAFALRSRAS